MTVAILVVIFLIIATAWGQFLRPTDAELQAKAFVPPTDASAGHDDHAHHGHGHH